jgi:hypothetical protein
MKEVNSYEKYFGFFERLDTFLFRCMHRDDGLGGSLEDLADIDQSLLFPKQLKTLPHLSAA